jgi:hypothetical protein
MEGFEVGELDNSLRKSGQLVAIEIEFLQMKQIAKRGRKSRQVVACQI